MQASNVPVSFPAIFANAAGGGYIRAIPTASQIGITAGAASLHDGFPPVTFIPVGAGGTPPFGQDFNGILNEITAAVQWAQAGGYPVYNSTFSTAIGGYPLGAVLQSADGTGFWYSSADNNTTNPDSGGANWTPYYFFGTTAVSGLTNANVTLSALQAARPIIVLTGTLTGNINIVFPVRAQQWLVLNNTTGAFTITCKTASGTGIVTPAGSTTIYGDGTNIQQTSLTLSYASANFAALAGSGSQTFSVGAAVSAAHAVRFDQALGLGQTWQDLTASRASGVTYTNSTGRPIMVWTSIVSGSTVFFTVNGVQGPTNQMGGSVTIGGIGCVVPPGHTYILNVGTPGYWAELRA